MSRQIWNVDNRRKNGKLRATCPIQPIPKVAYSLHCQKTPPTQPPSVPIIKSPKSHQRCRSRMGNRTAYYFILGTVDIQGGLPKSSQIFPFIRMFNAILTEVSRPLNNWNFHIRLRFRHVSFSPNSQLSPLHKSVHPMERILREAGSLISICI